MRWTLKTSFAIAVLVSGLLVLEVFGDGIMTVLLVTYRNPSGKGDNGHCCDGKWMFCEIRGCDHYFTVCVDRYDGSDSVDSCAVGSITTGVTHDTDVITFGRLIGGTDNPLLFRFNRLWGGVKIKVEVWDDDSGVNNRDYVDKLTVSIPTTSSGTYRKIVDMRSRTSLQIFVNIYCDQYYYGSACAVYCKRQDDVHGHYECDQVTGHKICHRGWTEVDCSVDRNDCEDNPCRDGSTCIDKLDDFECRCARGYEGRLCKTNTNDCASSPCLHRAKCIDGIASFTCRCAAGWEGLRCRSAIDECASNPCQHGGYCEDRHDSFTCTCLRGYAGTTCELEHNPCESDPCMNSGTCLDEAGLHSCVCLPGFTGINCGTNINECASSPCHGTLSSCLDIDDGYVCSCPLGWEGSRCDVDIDECLSDPCTHNVTCTDVVNGYTCACTPGWSGDDCQINIYECASAPCAHNQDCVDDVNGYTCNCSLGWTGRHCDENIDECETNPCENNSTCSDLVPGYNCSCALGWSGARCEVDMDDCETRPCFNNATCIDSLKWFACNCSDGWTGPTCNVSVDPCISSPCGGASECFDAGNGHAACRCAIGWTGVTCHDDTNECLDDPCFHQGNCTNTPGSFNCSCVDWYTGITCNETTDYCAEMPCSNNGTCANLLGSYMCTCQAGTFGTQCEFVIDSCLIQSCQNDGTCVDTNDGIICLCAEGYSGNNCEMDAQNENSIDDEMSSPFGKDGVQEGAIMFLGDLNDTEVGVVSHMVRHVTAGHLNVSVDELAIKYQLARCYTGNKSLVTMFIFRILRRGKSLAWSDVERSFSLMTSQSFLDRLPRPIYVGGDCFHDKWPLASQYRSSPGHLLSILIPILVLTVLILAASVFIIRRKRHAHFEVSMPMNTGLTQAQVSPEQNCQENTHCFANAVYETIDDVTPASACTEA